MVVDDYIIDLKHVKKSFDEHEVLKDINLNVSKGENVVVLGKSGTGKSVILKCIIGLITPDAGEVLLFNEDICKLTYNKLQKVRRRVGFLFQSGALYDSMTVKENLEFPLVRYFKLDKSELKAKVEEALDDVGLLNAIDKTPSELSGGMKKRIGLARTLIVNPEIMLYDEPTTGLDPATSREISHYIMDLQKKYHDTSIIVTHDMACVKLTANRIVVLKDGVCYMDGTYDEFERSTDEFIKSFFE